MASDRSSVLVIALADDDLSDTKASLSALAAQTWGSIDLCCYFLGTKKLCEFSTLVSSAFPSARVEHTRKADLVSVINQAVFEHSAEYVTMLAPGDVYRPDRIETLVREGEDRRASVLISYVEILDFEGKVLPADHGLFRGYSHALLTNIAAHPSLSFMLLWHDVVVSPGNLFLRKDVFVELGGFRDFQTLYAYDFVLRAAHLEEPTIITQKLLACRPMALDRFLRPIQAVEDERAEIVRFHIVALSDHEPRNRMCDVLRRHSFMFAGVPWSVALADAVDGLVEKRRAERGPAASPPPAEMDLKGDAFTLLTHELSLTGAPVIVLELAALLRERGAQVTVISPTDGPLRAAFEAREIRITLLPALPSRLQALERYLANHPEPRRQLVGFVKWLLLVLLRFAMSGAEYLAGRKMSQRVKGALLVNSVAAWHWVDIRLRTKGARLIWFIHETFDPKWISSASADRRFREKIADGALTMIYGSDATRRAWEVEGYTGRVKYWSGIRASAFPGDQRSAAKPTSRGRVILNVGSVGARKGTGVLLEAFALARAERLIPDDIELRIVGCPKPSGNQEARDLVFRTLRPDLKGAVRIVGQLHPDAISSYYDEADIYVHASFFDCMPISILTAMARGLPIVATNVDGCGEAIIDGVSGLLVPPRAPRQLAEAIAALVHDADLRERLGVGARRLFVEKFSVDVTLEPVRRVLQE